MSDVNELTTRIDNAFTSVKDKIKTQQQEGLKNYQVRQKLFKDYEVVQARVMEIARPRLEALAKRAGDRVSVTPSVSESRRTAKFDFKSPTAYLTLSFSVAPDRALANAVVERDLQIVPVLWKFDSHAEFSSPIASFDEAGLVRWIDDQIIGFVELYIQIHESEIVDKAEFVEDPIAKVSFPKFAAGATLEHGGESYFFIDEGTKAEFAKQNGIAAK